MAFKLQTTTYGLAAARMPLSGVTMKARFQVGGTPAPQLQSVVSTQGVKFDLTTRFGEALVPGSVNFVLGGKRYFDRLGSLFTDLEVATGAATAAGTVNYSTGEATVTNWVSGQPAGITLTSLLTSTGDNTVSGATFRVPVAPVRPGSLQILATRVLGGLINVTAALDGTITGTGVRGKVEYETGVVGIEFGAMVPAAGNEGQAWYDASKVVAGQIWKPAFVFAETMRFNAIAYSYLPIDSTLLGIDPVRLPQDGRVPIYRKGGSVVFGNKQTTVPAAVGNGDTVNLGRQRLARVKVIGANGVTINTGHTVDLELGIVLFTDVTGYSQPVRIEHRIEDMALVTDVQINGQIALAQPLSHDYPAGSIVSSAVMAGDRKARVSLVFDQLAWNGTTWSDAVMGDGAVGQFNDIDFPIVVKNRGALTERWILKFVTSGSVQVIGEHVGVLGTFPIVGVIAPINPGTGTPYMTINPLSFGEGWIPGNIIRINTIGTPFPVWGIRTVQPGAVTVLDDKATLLGRGDINRP